MIKLKNFSINITISNVLLWMIIYFCLLPLKKNPSNRNHSQYESIPLAKCRGKLSKMLCSCFGY